MQGKAVAALVFRVFGARCAEVPLVATRLSNRREGHAQVLMGALQALLAEAGVAAVCLPAGEDLAVCVLGAASATVPLQGTVWICCALVEFGCSGLALLLCNGSTGIRKLCVANSRYLWGTSCLTSMGHGGAADAADIHFITVGIPALQKS